MVAWTTLSVAKQRLGLDYASVLLRKVMTYFIYICTTRSKPWNAIWYNNRVRVIALFKRPNAMLLYSCRKGDGLLGDKTYNTLRRFEMRAGLLMMRTDSFFRFY
jgi:hypothetical protein